MVFLLLVFLQLFDKPIVPPVTSLAMHSLPPQVVLWWVWAKYDLLPLFARSPVDGQVMNSGFLFPALHKIHWIFSYQIADHCQKWSSLGFQTYKQCSSRWSSISSLVGVDQRCQSPRWKMAMVRKCSSLVLQECAVHFRTVDTYRIWAKYDLLPLSTRSPVDGQVMNSGFLFPALHKICWIFGYQIANHCQRWSSLGFQTYKQCSSRRSSVSSLVGVDQRCQSLRWKMAMVRKCLSLIL